MPGLRRWLVGGPAFGRHDHLVPVVFRLAVLNIAFGGAAVAAAFWHAPGNSAASSVVLEIVLY